MASKWTSLRGEGYLLEDLGRPAVFLLPIKKLHFPMGETTVEEELHQFLIKNYGSYTTSTVPSFGFWKDLKRATILDECRIYEVSILGRKKVPPLLRKLADIAIAMQEECIYVKAGQYAALVYPKKSSS